MGIDKPDVRYVVHMDLPKSMEAYCQETGRDGEPAEAWMIYGLQDIVRLNQMLDQSNAGEQQKCIERHKLGALLSWCEIDQYRRNALLNYFGDIPGSNCDNCPQPPKTRDGTEAAQELLPCIYRTGQRFGSAHVIDVLLGKETNKVIQFQHQTLSIYGIGKEYS